MLAAVFRKSLVILTVFQRHLRLLYLAPVVENSTTGPGNPWDIGAQAPPFITTAGAAFVPAYACYGGCAWEAFESAGFAYSPGFQPAYSCHPFAWKRMERLTSMNGSYTNEHF